MLYFISVWILLLVICSIIGTGVLNTLGVNHFERLGDRWIVSEWVGMVVLAVGLLAVSIVLPVNSVIGLIFALLVCALCCLNLLTRYDLTTFISSLSKQKIIGYSALFVVIASLTSSEVTWIDTGLYHYSLIQWLNQFGTVRGLSLLFENLGFTSSWFALAAPLNSSILDARVTAVTNGFAALLIVLHLLICLGYLIEGKARASDWFMSVFAFTFLLLTIAYPPSRIILISPSPDFPVGLLVGVTAWAILTDTPVSLQKASTETEFNQSQKTDQQGSKGAIVPLILASGALSFKLTGLPLLFAACLYLVGNYRFQIRLWLVAADVVSLLLLPFFVVNVLTSGCLLFPSTTVCFDLPWTHDTETLQSVATDTHGWTSWYGAPPPGIPTWLWATWQWLNEGTGNKAMAFLLGVSAILSIYVLKVAVVQRYYQLIWLVVLSITGMMFFMLTSPFQRFIMPYVLLVPTLAIALYLMNRSQQQMGLFQAKFIANIKSHQLLISLAPLFLAAVLTVGSVSSNYSKLFLPPRMQRVPIEQTQINDIPYHKPVGGELCWATDIPCAYGILHDITFRDPAQGYEAGFVQRVEQ